MHLCPAHAGQLAAVLGDALGAAGVVQVDREKDLAVYLVSPL
jgi:hypothetical protein